MRHVSCAGAGTGSGPGPRWRRPWARQKGCALRVSLGHTVWQLCGLRTRRIGPDGDQERPPGGHLGCSCVCRPAAAGGPPSVLNPAGGSLVRPKAEQFAGACGRAAPQAVNDADRPGWRLQAFIGLHLGCSCVCLPAAAGDYRRPWVSLAALGPTKGCATRAPPRTGSSAGVFFERRRWRCLTGSRSILSGVECCADWCRFWPGGAP